MAKQEEATRLDAHLKSVEDQLSSLRSERDAHVHQLTELVSSQEKHLAALRFV
jgi:septal ring factor EnvC (AmiA/AmiB activator)